jgi:hypothetical protein
MGLGLLREGINEVIATTYLNAAPMGIVFRRGEARMVVYRGSHTAEQIEDRGWVVANFLFDPVLFVKTAFEALPPGFFTPEPVEEMIMQRLAGTEAWAAFRAVVERRTTEALMVRLELLKHEIITPTVHPVNRGFNSVIEATVHATRYQVTGNPELRGWIEHHAGIIRKCGGAREQEALQLLSSYLDDMKNKII